MRDAEMRQGFKSSAAQLADAAGLAYQIEGDQKAEALRLRKQNAAEAQQVIENEAAQAAAGREVEALRLKTAADGRAAEAHAQALRLANEEGARKAADDARKTADAARAQAIERISALDETQMGEGVNTRQMVIDIGAQGGLSADEALQAYRNAMTQRSNAEDARKLTAANTESQIKARDAGVAQGWRGLEIQKEKADAAGQAKATPDGAPDTRTRTKARQLATAAGVLDEIERTAAEFEKATSGDAMGRITGKVRGKLTGYVPGLNEAERTKFLANAEALNAMLFPVLGREDAPTETEVKRLAPLMIGGETTPDELGAKIGALRRMLEIQAGTMPGGTQAPPAPDPSARPAGSDFAKR
ncbi:MAG: hypothetical protein VW547_06310 [Alphaproteobacteria bacterium]